MILAFIWTLLASFSDIFWKKSLSYGVGDRAHELSSYFIPLVLLSYFFITWFTFSEVPFLAFVIIAVTIVIDAMRLPVLQQIYKEEKMSVIMPYLNINRILIIIASFFIFQDVSVTALCITIFAIIILWVLSIDFKTLKFPKCFSKILFSEIAKTIWVLFAWWLIVEHWEIWYFNAYILIWLMLNVILVYYTGQFKDLQGASNSYWKERTLWSIWWFSWFLSMVVISDLGLSISILLWFLGVGVTLLFSYFILKDTPSKKDLISTAVIMILIWIWYHFK